MNRQAGSDPIVQPENPAVIGRREKSSTPHRPKSWRRQCVRHCRIIWLAWKIRLNDLLWYIQILHICPEFPAVPCRGRIAGVAGFIRFEPTTASPAETSFSGNSG